MSATFNHCPASLSPLVLEVLTAETAPVRESSDQQPISTQGIHDKTMALQGEDFDQLMVLYYHAFGSPFSCHDEKKGIEHTLSFVNKPEVLRETITDDSRQYTVRIQLLKLPG